MIRIHGLTPFRGVALRLVLEGGLLNHRTIFFADFFSLDGAFRLREAVGFPVRLFNRRDFLENLFR